MRTHLRTQGNHRGEPYSLLTFSRCGHGDRMVYEEAIHFDDIVYRTAVCIPHLNWLNSQHTSILTFRKSPTPYQRRRMRSTPAGIVFDAQLLGTAHTQESVCRTSPWTLPTKTPRLTHTFSCFLSNSSILYGIDGAFPILRESITPYLPRAEMHSIHMSPHKFPCWW